MVYNQRYYGISYQWQLASLDIELIALGQIMTAYHRNGDGLGCDLLAENLAEPIVNDSAGKLHG